MRVAAKSGARFVALLGFVVPATTFVALRAIIPISRATRVTKDLFRGSLDAPEFTLQRMYDFEKQLKQRFPRNDFIRAKIRQQLQVLRDAGLIVFEGRGRYAVNCAGGIEWFPKRDAPLTRL
jgi:DpnI-like restriction endonuclease